jgi:hypothetical protein
VLRTLGVQEAVLKKLRSTLLASCVLVAVSVAGAGSASAQDPLMTGAGDISCDPKSSYFRNGSGTGSGYGPSAYCKQLATSRLLSDANVVYTLGDNQYEHASYSNFLASYNRSWGTYKFKTRPAIGNHEYGPGLDCLPTRCTPNLGEAGYFDYFGSRAGPRPAGYYSYDVGTWHVIVLNSMCFAAGGCEAGSPQEQWLRSDLAANQSKKCVLAYWHHPPFSSGQSRGNPTLYDPFWRALHEARADVVLVGHDHVYERFGRQSYSGSASSTGPRQFMVGTGGKNIGKFVTVQPNSQKRVRAHGVLRLRLRPTDYVWKFARIGDGASLDSGSSSCV